MRQTQSSSNTTTNIGLILVAVVFWLAGSYYVYQNGIEWFMPKEASAEAEAVDGLFRFMLGIATFIFLLVETLLFGFLVRYGIMRDRNDESDGPHIHGNTALELIWTLIPSIIVFVLTIYSFDVLVSTTEAKDDEFQINVTAQRFFWQFQYPDDEFNITSNHVLVVPQDETIRLEMTSTDVIHAFWVPAFRVKQDVMPGRTTELRFTPTEWTGLPPDYELVTLDDLDVPTEETACPIEDEEAAAEAATSDEEAAADNSEEASTVTVVEGSGGIVPPVSYEVGYDLVCAELCGPNHGVMRGKVFVVTRDEFDAYIESQKAVLQANKAQQEYAIRCGGAAIAEAGRALFQQYGCNTCHALADVGSVATTGPNLSNIGNRAATYPGYDTPEDYIHTSIVNPNAFIADGYPSGVMPQNFVDRIAPEEIDLLVAYLSQQKQ